MRRTALALTLILALLFSVVAGTRITHFVRANFVGPNNPSPDPISPSITVHSPTNNVIINSTNASLNFTLNLPAIRHDQYGLWVYSSVSWIGYSLDELEKITVQNKSIKYADDPKAVDFSVNLTSLAEGPHRLVVTTAYSSFYPAMVNSSSPTVFEYSDTINFTVNTAYPEISILSLKNETYGKTDIHLNFTINEPVSWIGYSLDGQANVTMMGNTTLTELSYGSHALTIYANDTVGNVGTSSTIDFSIAKETELFPTTLVAAGIVSVAVVGAGLLVYFKKRNH